MLYFVIGLPGHFAAWCDAVALGLVRQAHGTGAALGADSLPDLAAGAIRTALSHGVIAVRRPGGQLREVLAEAGQRFVVALDDARLALLDLVNSDDPDIAAMLPVMASSCAAVTRYDRAPGALVIHAQQAAADPLAAATAMAEHFGLQLGGDEVAAVVAGLAEAGVTAGAAISAERWHALDDKHRGWAEGALAGYINYFETGALTPLAWVRELFFLGDRPEERASWIIDITGRARCLLQGPGIMIAPGTWQIVIKLLFSHEATEHEFLVELAAGNQAASAIVRPEREGQLEVSFPLTLDEVDNHPLMIRVSNQRAAFDGACAMDAVALVPQQG